MKRITLGEFKRITRGLPDDAIICCQSDSEGNQTSTCLNFFIDQVGRKVSMTYNDKVYDFTIGDDVDGIDMEKDKGKTVVFLQPSL